MLALVTSALSVVVLLTAGSGWLLAGYVSSHLGRVNAGTAGHSGQRTAEHPAGRS